MIFGRNPYWVKIITWEFGSGKTYNVYLEAFRRKISKENPFIIANIPYSFVDLVYTWIEDLKKIFQILVEYSKTTNTKEVLENYWKFRPIIFILDEAHLYFFSRWFAKNFDKEQLIILTQVRKRKISMYLITQELAQLDSTFRRLVPAVRKYYKWFGFWRWRVDYYFKKDDVDMKDPMIAEKIWWWPIFGAYMAPSIKAKFVKLLKSPLQKYFDDFWTSYFITGFWKTLPLNYNLDKFLKDLYNDKKENENKNDTSIDNKWDKEKKKRTLINSGKNGSNT